MALLYPLWMKKDHDDYNTTSILKKIQAISEFSDLKDLGTIIRLLPLLVVPFIYTDGSHGIIDNKHHFLHHAEIVKCQVGLLEDVKSHTNRTPLIYDLHSLSDLYAASLECLSRIVHVFVYSKLPKVASMIESGWSGLMLLDLFGFTREVKIDETSQKLKTETLDIILPYMKKTIKELNCDTAALLNSEKVRKAQWNFMCSACLIFDESALSEFATIPREVASSNKTETARSETNLPLISWMFQLPIMDPDEKIRDYTAQMIGDIMLSNDCKVLKILFGNDRCFPETTLTDAHGAHPPFVEKLYERFDHLLYKYCGVSQSQLSFTAGLTHTSSQIHSSFTNSEAFDMRKSRHISAMKVLYSICQAAKHMSSSDLRDSIFEKGLIRLVRFWISGSPLIGRSINSFSDHDISIVAFKMIHELHIEGMFGSEMSCNLKKTLIPGLFCEVLCQIPIDSSMKSLRDEKKYIFLIELIQKFLISEDSLYPFSVVRSDNEREISRRILSYVEGVLPLVFTAIVIEQDYETLCQCTDFYHYVLSRTKSKKDKEGCPIKKVMTLTELKRETSKLCSTDNDRLRIFRTLLPRLLMESDKGPLLFYLRKVLDSCTSLREILIDKEVMVVREIVWEIGGTAYNDVHTDQELDNPNEDPSLGNDDASRALQKAALVILGKRIRNSQPEKSESNGFQSLDGLESLDLEFSQKAAELSVDQLVQKHFMMLLVNNVTMRWKNGDINDKIQALRCLRVLLNFLSPSDSSHYVTQILNMVDTAMHFENEDDTISILSKVHYSAAKALGKFVHILMSSDWKIVAENLSKIIVCLFPLLKQKPLSGNDKSLIGQKAVKEAVNILQYLVGEANGERLAPYFSNIPFLPKNPILNDVRKSLDTYGINFDSLLLFHSEGNTGNNETGTPGLDATCSPSVCSSHLSKRIPPKVVAAFRGRLQSLMNLFHHESDNVRRAVYLDLKTLIRGNRHLFQSMIESCDASMRFLTVSKKYPSNTESPETQMQLADNTSATHIVLEILRRCKHELNDENILILSQCLGEIGAIAPSMIGEDTFQSENETTGGSSNNWMLEHGSPWKFQSVKIHCELQLVTNKFVVALKAAPTPIDVHLIAFGVQEGKLSNKKCYNFHMIEILIIHSSMDSPKATRLRNSK